MVLPGSDPGVGFGPGYAAAWGFDPAPSWGTAGGSVGSQPRMESLTLGPGVAAVGSFLQIRTDKRVISYTDRYDNRGGNYPEN